ncbi:helix-turn-helix domain-containing protein [Streptomyces sp. UNOB3_S3]|uniref:winged helix-turn-helix transcriptional regulator n=1 Tax=Streptomyces sp. UNOB3_S3 TaxID=2871682 RepID=UPI001E55FAB7|nr:helix-turn-helix domain-containing protein [Streptomyces sp. UNOB3_S3]
MGRQTETHATETHVWDPDLAPTTPGRTLRPDADCPVEIALAAVAGRWTTLVLRVLIHAPHSFGTLREQLPEISPKMLADRLSTLCERGLVDQERLAGFPVRTRYTLTPAGQALHPLLIELYRTGEELSAARPVDRART